MYSVNDTLAGGLPHSDIHGSTPARGSPWLFAACHVLHRLLVPRHPPNALILLDTVSGSVRIVTTMHGNHRQISSNVPIETIRDDPVVFLQHKTIHNASEHSPTRRWGACAFSLTWMWSTENGSFPGQTFLGQRSFRHTHPETHQNHIHTAKEQACANGANRIPG